MTEYKTLCFDHSVLRQVYNTVNGGDTGNEIKKECDCWTRSKDGMQYVGYGGGGIQKVKRANNECNKPSTVEPL